MARNDDTIDPPHTFTVDDRNRPALWSHDGTPPKRQIGFAMQTTGTCPPLSDNTKRKPKRGK